MEYKIKDTKNSNGNKIANGYISGVRGADSGTKRPLGSDPVESKYDLETVKVYDKNNADVRSKYLAYSNFAVKGAHDITTKGGVWNLTDLSQFAPYEGGYCLISVLNSPNCMKFKTDGSTYTKNDSKKSYNYLLQEAFVNMIEKEFRGLDGIDDITSETLDITDNISTMSIINKINLQSNGTFSMRFTEKAGSLVTKYVSRYLKCIRDVRTRAKTYNGIISVKNLYGSTQAKGSTIDPGLAHEVFNFLYIITDATYLRVEKAFLILNAQPTIAAYSELYNMERGNIEVKEISVPFNGFLVDGAYVNSLATKYVEAMVSLGDFKAGSYKYQMNSDKFKYTMSGISDQNGNHLNLTKNPTLSFK